MRLGLKFVLLPIFAVVISESHMGQTSAGETVVMDGQGAVPTKFSF